MMHKTHALPAALCLAVLSSGCAIGGEQPQESPKEIRLSAMDLALVVQGYGKAAAGKSVTGKPLTLGTQVFADGVGTHSTGVWHIALDGKARKFSAKVGVDADVGAKGAGSVEFLVVGDGRVLWRSGICRGGDAPKDCAADLAGVRHLVLLATEGGDGNVNDHADWADAAIAFSGEEPKTVAAPKEEPVVLSPKAGPEPRINGPKIYGARPGHPFIYRIPCTGERPMVFSAENLPAGLVLDGATGIVTGTTPAAGDHRITFKARNAKGESTRTFLLRAGETLSLTPQMGWNSWYTYFFRVTDADMRKAADILVSSGMADAGYAFVNVDDCWFKSGHQSAWYNPANRFGQVRDAAGNIIPNGDFPDMKGLADHIHAKGLKAGIYLSPGTKTCTGAVGSYGHYAKDAKQLADWGYDFLKFDSYIGIPGCEGGERAPLANLKKPYQEMGDLLKAQPRDIVFNLCQYGWGESWKWGKEVGGHSWRTAGDLGFELHRIHDIALANAKNRDFSGPGGWNDPDYLQIGWVASQVGSNLGQPHPSALTPAEQYSFMSLWCLLPAPLFYGGDLTHLDDFTLGILCNPEVIAVNQDALGKPGVPVPLTPETYLLVKDLEDGTKAVGLCNKGECELEVTAKWSDLGVAGKQPVRDLWRRRDLGEFKDAFTAVVPRHGVVMVKIGK